MTCICNSIVLQLIRDRLNIVSTTATHFSYKFKSILFLSAIWPLFLAIHYVYVLMVNIHTMRAVENNTIHRVSSKKAS